MFQFWSGFFAILIFPLLVCANPPWQRQKERQSPWGIVSGEKSSIERAKNRENFFGTLSKLQNSQPENFQQTPATELRQLPWQSYAREWDVDFEEDFIWPVAGGKISSGFGFRHGKTHEGLDIKANEGTLIRAISHGKVVFEGWMSGYGRMIVIAHGDGYASVYAHNQDHLVKRGQIVKKGQAIAKLGSSGRVSGPHVHFEVRKDGKALNPLRFHYAGRWEEQT